MFLRLSLVVSGYSSPDRCPRSVDQLAALSIRSHLEPLGFVDTYADAFDTHGVHSCADLVRLSDQDWEALGVKVRENGLSRRLRQTLLP